MNEQQKDLNWLGRVEVPDLLDQSFDLSQGSTKAWWENVEEIPMDLHSVKTEELEAELKRRREKPQVLNGVHPKYVRELCEKFVDSVWKNGYSNAEGDDLRQYIFEAAMTAVYGDNIFNILNQRMRSLYEQSK